MSRCPALRKKANEIIQNYKERGYITVVNDKGSKNNAEWYLPIFAVQNPNKTRLVWDAAAKYNDRSLNDFLLKGPDLNETLWNTLYRFREYPVAFCADVSEMFHRIQVAQEDRRFQRFL